MEKNNKVKQKEKEKLKYIKPKIVSFNVLESRTGGTAFCSI